MLCCRRFAGENFNTAETVSHADIEPVKAECKAGRPLRCESAAAAADVGDVISIVFPEILSIISCFSFDCKQN